MELNREQIQKALDWLDSLVGNSNDSDMALFTYQLLGILYDTCEELTEENERLLARNFELSEKGEKVVIAYKKLSEENERLKNICESYMLQYGTVTDKEAFLKNERADTLREYGEKVYQLILGCFGDKLSEQNKDFITVSLGQFAKEMLEGEK